MQDVQIGFRSKVVPWIKIWNRGIKACHETNAQGLEAFFIKYSISYDWNLLINFALGGTHLQGLQLLPLERYF